MASSRLRSAPHVSRALSLLLLSLLPNRLMPNVRARKNMTLSKIVFISLLLYLGILGCDKAEKNQTEKEISASATAVFHSDGSITTRDSTKKEEQRIGAIHRKMQEIDQKYPPPMEHEQYTKLELYEIDSINEQGHIVLKNGITLAIEGVECGDNISFYLKKLLFNENSKVAYLPSSNSEATPLPAYIWHADFSLLQDHELKDLMIGPSYSSVNETTLANGWCSVAKTDNNKYQTRFLELEKAWSH